MFFLNSGTQEPPPYRRWYLPVGLLAGLFSRRPTPVSAGSSSRPLTTSSISSEGVAPMRGLYGSVTVGVFFWPRCPNLCPWIDERTTWVDLFPHTCGDLYGHSTQPNWAQRHHSTELSGG